MSIYTNGKTGLPQPGLDAAREGRFFNRYINDLTGVNVAGGTVVTNTPNAYLNLQPGYRYIVVCAYYTLTTASDTVRFELVTTSLPNGLGEVTALTVEFFGATTATGDGIQNGPIHFSPAYIAVTTALGQTLAMRVETNDQGATVNCGFNGWWEFE